MSCARAVFLFLSISFSFSVTAEDKPGETIRKRFDIPGHGALLLLMPSEWKSQVQQSNDNVPPTFRFIGERESDFQVLLTVLWPNPGAAPDFGKPEGIRKMVEHSRDMLATHAEETNIKIEQDPGYWFSITDKAPKPDEFKFMTTGAARIGGFVVIFSAFSNEGQEQIVVNALEMVRTAQQDNAGATPMYYAESAIHLPVPGQSWEINFPQGTWSLANTRSRTDQKGYYVHFEDRRSKINASFFIEPAEKCKTSTDCRELFWKDPGAGYKGARDHKRLERSGFAVMQCEVPIKVGEIEMGQLHYSAHYVRDGYWIDMHLSKTLTADKSKDVYKEFDAFIDTLVMTSIK